MLRIGLFVLSNLGVMLIASLVFKVFGLEQFLASQGVNSNLTGLLIFCAVFGFGGSIISLMLSKTLAKRGTRTQVITQPRTADEAWLLETVAELSNKANIKMPEVGIFPSAQPNAFATGWNKNDALVAVSAGLLQRFDREETKAVMAHEIGHVANGDMVTLALLQGVVNTFVMFFARIIGGIIDRAVFKNERGNGLGYMMIVFVTEMVLGIIASMIVMAFSRYREYRADAAGAELASRQSMIRALQRLKTDLDQPNELPGELNAFGISGNWKKQLFSSHPPLDNRIEALLKQG